MKSVSTAFNDIFNLDEDIYLTQKLVCEFGSNRFNDGQVVTASSVKLSSRGVNRVQTESAEFWRAEDAFNNKDHDTMNWLVCDEGATVKAEADGTGHRCVYLDGSEDLERGWWSATTSDSGGNFGSPEWVQSEFFEDDGTTPFGRRVNLIKLFTPEGYDNMKSVTVQYKNSVGTWVVVETNRILGTSEYEVTWTIDPEQMVYGLRVYVNSTHRPNSKAKISELNAYYIVDVSEDVVSMDIIDSREEYEESTVPVGTHRANTLNFRLDNTQGLYNKNNGDSPYAPYIGSEVRVLPSIGVDLNKGVGTPNYEYVQMGEFWTDDFEATSGEMTASASCRDFSKFLQDEENTRGHLWKNTNLAKIIRDVAAFTGLPLSKTDIDESNLRGLSAVFIKDQDFWSFLNEVCFADQGIFGLDHEGKLFFHSYNRLDSAPYDTPQVSYMWDRNIIDATLRTKLYLNRVIIKSNPIEERVDKKQNIWSPPDDDILQWSRLGANIDATQTTIPTQIASNQKTASLTDNNWHESGGILFIPEYSAPNEEVIVGDREELLSGGELIKYNSRTDSDFLECERGYLGTEAQAWEEGKFIGEARYYEMEFDKAPATNINWPFVTAIDTLRTFADEGLPQAAVLIFEHDAFVGKLCIANLVDYQTWLQGSGQTRKDFMDNSFQSIFDFNTAVSGVVLTEKAGREQINGDADPDTTAENKDLIRRYGLNKIEIDNPWIQNKNHAQDIVDILISEYKNPRDVIELDVLPNPALSTGDRVTIVNFPQLDIVNKDYHVIELTYDYDGGLRGRAVLREVRE